MTAKFRDLPFPPNPDDCFRPVLPRRLPAGALCGWGAWKLWQSRSAPSAQFQQAKQFAIAGLTLSMLQWFVAFITVGGEWFLMWQSSTWNGQDAAFRMFGCLGIMLLFLNHRDD